MKKIIFVVTVLLSVSCTNKNVDDWRKSRAAEEAARLKQAAGNYRGAGTSRFDQSPMGTFDLYLEADMETAPRPDGVGTEGRATFKGRLIHLGETRATLSFKSGYYDDQSGTIILDIPIKDKKVKIYGTIRNGVLDANIEAEDSSDEFGAHVVLKKTAETTPMEVPEPTNTGIEVSRYSGSFTLPNNQTTSSVMQITNPTIDPQMKFYNLLVRTKEVEVGLTFFDGDIQISTPRGHLDTYFHTLSAIFETSGSSGDRFTNKLVCSGLPDDAWKCEFTNAKIGVSKGVLTRVR